MLDIGKSSSADSGAIRSITSNQVDNFDWTSYEGTYKGRALITRLMHIPRFLLHSNQPRTPTSMQLARTALLRVIPHVQSETWDIALYLNCVAQISETLGRKSPFINQLNKNDESMAEDSNMNMDIDQKIFSGVGKESEGIPNMEWVEEIRNVSKKHEMGLSVELTGYMSNLIKESIRLTYLAMANHSVKTGNPTQALKHLSSAREYCTSPTHHLELGLTVLQTCISFNQPGPTTAHFSKIESALDRVHPPNPTTATTNRNTDAAALTAADVRENRERDAQAQAVRKSVGVKIRVGKGLIALMNKDFERAGRELGEIGDEGGLGDWEGQGISTADLALLSALCILATGKRSTVRHLLLDRTSFRASVDDSQSWLLDVIRAFVGAQYGEVLAILKQEELSLLLNPFLATHVPTLMNKIYTRSMIQYVEPFSSVQISTMAETFSTDTSKMLKEIENLVGNGNIDGKIDLIDNVLRITAPDARAEVYRNALRVGKITNDLSKAALLRLKLAEANIIVDPRPIEQKQRGQNQNQNQNQNQGDSKHSGNQGPGIAY